MLGDTNTMNIPLKIHRIHHTASPLSQQPARIFFPRAGCDHIGVQTPDLHEKNPATRHSLYTQSTATEARV